MKKSEGKKKNTVTARVSKEAVIRPRVLKKKKMAAEMRRLKQRQVFPSILDLAPVARVRKSRKVINLAHKEVALDIATEVFVDSVEKATSRLQKLSRRMMKGRTLIGFAATILIVVLASAPLLLAFEAHVINVTATVIMLDPPVILPPGGTFTGPITITIDDSDPDVSHIFYTVTPGTDPNPAPDPVCGISAGGPKPIGSFPLSADAVIKAIGCDSGAPGGHGSLITQEIYHFISPNGTIEGRKCHDLNQNGICDGEDFFIQGWHMDLLQNNAVASSTVTDANGFYIFPDLTPAMYAVREESRDGWLHVTPDTATTTVAAGETATLNFFNLDTGFACTPFSISFPPLLALQAAGTTSGNDDVSMASNVTINGDVRSNDEIEKTTGSSNDVINGNATTTNTIDGGITVTGLTSTGAPTAALPDAKISTWKTLAQQGGTVNGSFNFPNGTTGLQLGPTEILGNVTFGTGNSTVINGPLYIHGNLSIGSNSTIAQAPAFGNQFIAIIVDGTITINSNVSFNGSGSLGTFLLVSTHAAVAGDAATIETNSNNSDLGDVLLYASDGDIHVRANRTFLAAFAAHGTGADTDANAAIRLDANVSVNYRTLPSTGSCGPRQPFESTAHILVNEFMPQPTGGALGKTGTAGAPLDGEWVELFNPTAGAIDVSGYVLYDNNNSHALPITLANVNAGSLSIPSQGYLVVYREGDLDFSLDVTGGDSVRLFSGLIGSGGVLVDSHTYTANAAVNKSFARIPSGSPNWIDPDATPGSDNDFFFQPLDHAASALDFIPPVEPLLVIDENGNSTIVPPMHPEAEDVVAAGQLGTTTQQMPISEEATTTTVMLSDTSTTTPAVATNESTTTSPVIDNSYYMPSTGPSAAPVTNPSTDATSSNGTNSAPQDSQASQPAAEAPAAPEPQNPPTDAGSSTNATDTTTTVESSAPAPAEPAPAESVTPAPAEPALAADAPAS